MTILIRNRGTLTLATVLVLGFVRAARAGTEQEIAAMNKTFLRSREVADTNAMGARKGLIDGFLRYVSILEQQYKTSGDQEALLACRQARAKYEPRAEKVDAPKKVPDQLSALLTALEQQLKNVEHQRASLIVQARERRTRNLTALRSGLVERGDRKGAELVADALRTEPPLPHPVQPTGADSSAARKTIVPRDFSYLTYDRPQKRWKPMADKGVRREDAEGTTSLQYVEGDHGLLKILWPEPLEVGDRFTIEVEGAVSAELVDLAGEDANARSATSLAETKGFVRVEIVREKDRIGFRFDELPQKTYYASGKLRGDEARAALLTAPLRPALTVKKGGTMRFRQATMTRP